MKAVHTIKIGCNHIALQINVYNSANKWYFKSGKTPLAKGLQQPRILFL